MSLPPVFFDVFFAVFSFLFGATIGSFLNVCIYRVPLNLSVNEPKRSFCPKCKYEIPWHANLPLITWLVQRGKCANCKAPIAFRYFAVELLTGLLFLTVWLHVAPENPGGLSRYHGLVAAAFCTFAGLLIVATFIDFEHFIIPDGITIGGAIAGILISFAVPSIHTVPLSPGGSGFYQEGLLNVLLAKLTSLPGANISHLEGLIRSAVGAGAGFGIVWLVAAGGKFIFGRKSESFDPPVDFAWTSKGETADFRVGEKSEEWIEKFTSEKDVLLMNCVKVDIEGKTFENIELRSRYEILTLAGVDYDLNKVQAFSGITKSLQFQRDAMGFGDVKFMACIGAFLGWQATLVTLVLASTIGAFVGIGTIVLRRKDWSAKIPFGPYLALGALIWVFFSSNLIGWWNAYLSMSEL